MSSYIFTPKLQHRPPKHQPDVNFSQAAPVQNTWYTILATTRNMRAISLAVRVATADETLEIEILIDGNTLLEVLAATADIQYYIHLRDLEADGLSADVTPSTARAFLIEGRSIRVRIRKTTALGAGTITAILKHAKY